MQNILVMLLALVQAGSSSIPATDVTAAEIQAGIEDTVARGRGDTVIRTVDAGSHHVGIAVIYRGPSTNVVAGTIHEEITEVYEVLEGSGTLVTGGRLIDARRRADTVRTRMVGGPGSTGTGVEGGVTRRITKGDMIIIPAGTPHYFSDVPESIIYKVVRFDPFQGMTLK